MIPFAERPEIYLSSPGVWGTALGRYIGFLNNTLTIKSTTHISRSIFTLLLQQHPAMQQQENLSSSGWISYEVAPLPPCAILRFAHSSCL